MEPSPRDGTKLISYSASDRTDKTKDHSLGTVVHPSPDGLEVATLDTTTGSGVSRCMTGRKALV